MPTEFMKRLLEKGSAATLEHFAKAQIAGRDTGLRQVDWVRNPKVCRYDLSR